MFKVQLLIIEGPFEAEIQDKIRSIVQEVGRGIAQAGDKTY
jgi:hypothetical protein